MEKNYRAVKCLAEEESDFAEWRSWAENGSIGCDNSDDTLGTNSEEDENIAESVISLADYKEKKAEEECAEAEKQLTLPILQPISLEEEKLQPTDVQEASLADILSGSTHDKKAEDLNICQTVASALDGSSIVTETILKDALKTKLNEKNPEVQKPIVLPEIQSMTDYITIHYLKNMLRDLALKLGTGEMCLHHNKHVYEALPWAELYDDEEPTYFSDDNSEPQEEPESWDDPRFPEKTIRTASIHLKEGIIAWHEYRLINDDSDVMAILTLSAKVQVKWYGLTTEFWKKFDVDVYFDMDEHISIDYNNFREHHYIKEYPGSPMDEYLVPILSRSDIENLAERIIGRIVPEGLEDPEYLRMMTFTERLGLKIVYLPLYKRPQTASILFFHAGKVKIVRGIGTKFEKVETVYVAENTIVINTLSGQNEREAVFHECFHYIVHRFFYKLQKLHNNDVVFIEQTRPVETKKNTKRNPIEWIEWQANYGSMCLQMPYTLLDRYILDKRWSLIKSCAHDGYKFELICRVLADKFHVRPFQVRNRMIWMGYSAAKGALNYVDGRFIEPFAFDEKKCTGKQTFVISTDEMIMEYVRNSEFRKLIDSGNYIHVDGHICINDPEYVVWHGDQLRLTKWANAHVDKCCLRFEKTYLKEINSKYVFGQLNSDVSYNEKSLIFYIENNPEAVAKKAEQIAKVMAKLPGSFSETLKAHMKRLGYTISELAENSMLSDATIKRMRNENRDFILDQILAVCFGMKLEPEYSLDLIEKAGFVLRKDNKQHLVYKALLEMKYKESIETIQNLLKIYGCIQLKLRDEAACADAG